MGSYEYKIEVFKLGNIHRYSLLLPHSIHKYDSSISPDNASFWRCSNHLSIISSTLVSTSSITPHHSLIAISILSFIISLTPNILLRLLISIALTLFLCLFCHLQHSINIIQVASLLFKHIISHIYIWIVANASAKVKYHIVKHGQSNNITNHWAEMNLWHSYHNSSQQCSRYWLA